MLNKFINQITTYFLTNPYYYVTDFRYVIIDDLIFKTTSINITFIIRSNRYSLVESFTLDEISNEQDINYHAVNCILKINPYLKELV